MERVVITGMGIVSPLGLDRASFWSALLAGTDGVGPAESVVDASRYRSQVAAEIKAAAYAACWGDERVDRNTRLAMTAVLQAVQDAGGSLPPGAGLVLGSVAGGGLSLEAYYRDRPVGRRAADLLFQAPCGAAGYRVVQELGLDGPFAAVSNACASGTAALGYAFDLVRTGRAPLMLAVGTDALNETAFGGFNAMRAMSDDRCTPFSRRRRGMVLGEGAAALVLEPLDAALARAARIYAELCGYGVGADAHHMTAPDVAGCARAMRVALSDAGIAPADVDYINAHGTATPLNDAIEAEAIRQVFGTGDRPLVSATKSMTGHMQGAAGTVEAIICALALRDGVVPHTLHLDEPDPRCALAHVAAAPIHRPLTYALSNSFGTGGNTASILFRRHEGEPA